MKTEQYARKPFLVDTVEVTAENMEEVAKWCGGKIDSIERGNRTIKFIKVPVSRPMNERQTKAFIGDRVLRAGKKSFKCYTAKAFDDCFEKPSEDGTVSIQNHPMLPFEGPLADTKAGQELQAKYAAGKN